MGNHPRARNRKRRCSSCGKRLIRPLTSIAKELRCVPPHQGFLQAAAHAVRIEMKGPKESLPADVQAAYWQGAEDGAAMHYAGGLAAELSGECVYCAHSMDPDRRQALLAMEESQKGGRHG